MEISLEINGQQYTVNSRDVPVDLTLNTFIRQHAELTGTKFMCLEGGCGACVVSVSRCHPQTSKRETFALNSCLKSLFTCDGYAVTTIEGLGSRAAGYHPLQTSINRVHGSQCGYCTGGMIMNMHALMEQHKPNDEDPRPALTSAVVEKSFGGNICRCTGYRPILDAFKSFACDASPELVSRCRDLAAEAEVLDIEDLVVVCRKQCVERAEGLRAVGPVRQDAATWYHVSQLAELLTTLQSIGTAPYMLVAGNTGRGVYRLPEQLKTFVDINDIAELHTIERTAGYLQFGSLVTLTEAIRAFRKAATCSGFEYCSDLADHFEQIANVPVRNVGTIGGNLGIKHAHPEFPSDVFVSLDTADARLTIVDSQNAKTTCTMREFLALDMRQRVLHNARLPRIDPATTAFRSYKIMIRAQNAHAYVNAGFQVRFRAAGNGKAKCVDMARICYGGINPQLTHAATSEQRLIGCDLYNNDVMQATFSALLAELQPDWVLPDAQPIYRQTLAIALFYRFVLATCPAEKLTQRNRSGASSISRPLSSGSQKYGTVKPNWPLTKPVPKYEGIEQVTGEAVYINDMPRMKGELWAAFAVAEKVQFTIAAVDASEALRMDGVHFFYTAKDIPGKNNFTPKSWYTSHEESVFLGINDVVLFNGQPVGVLLADSTELANRAAAKVRITYTEVPEASQSVFSMASAMLKSIIDTSQPKQLHPTIGYLQKPEVLVPDVVRNVTDGTTTIIGRYDLAGQYHYHMETLNTICVPGEHGTLDVYSGTQWVDFTQQAIAEMLAMPHNSLFIVVRRLGGAYGAKISRTTQVSCATALAAHLSGRPVRFVMQLEANMRSIGKRFGLHADYSVTINSTGRVQRLQCDYSQDAGCSLNESVVMDSTTQCFSNCYDSTPQTWLTTGHMVLTDAPSNTFCRSPGTLEGIAMGENLMEHISAVTGLDPMAVRLANMRADHPMRPMIAEFMRDVEFEKRRTEVNAFNAENRWRKRGIAVVPMQWPLSYLGVIPAYVAIYHVDGSVVVSHGGVECGQGINTKVAQVVAFALGVPLETVMVRPMDNVLSANATLTGSSCTSEMACYAAKKACDTILTRMKPVRNTLKPGYKWAELTQACFVKEIDLRETVQFKDTDVAAYNIYGMCACEVEVDILTGNYQLRRVDLWEDVGESMSPLVDIGQVEGAFVMGIGYWCTEQLVYDRNTGRLLTDRTWTYKPPGAMDIPVDFRIKFIQNSPNPIVGVLRSKAVGEPAICMSVAVVFALRYAIKEAQKDAGITVVWLPLGSALTPEQVFMNCAILKNAFTL